MEKKIKICMIIMFIMMTTTISVGAATLINSKDVIYDNTVSGLESTTVQGAVDELYSAATNYSSLSTKVTTLENKVQWHLIASPNMNLAEGENYIGSYDLSNYSEVLIKFGYVGYSSASVRLSLIDGEYSGNTDVLALSGPTVAASVYFNLVYEKGKNTTIKSFVNILYSRGIIVYKIYAR